MNNKIITDNASIHKNKEIGDLVEKAEHQSIFLPPCTQQLNPIEKHFFSMEKQNQV